MTFPMDDLVDEYINSLPKGTADISIARTFNHIQAFCQWVTNEIGRPPAVELFMEADWYREIRQKYLAAKPDFSPINSRDKKIMSARRFSAFRKLENHFKALVEMDLFVEWLRREGGMLKWQDKTN